MRKPCLECVYKHLADAAIWEIEYRLGYPQFKLYIVGSLNHASHEAFRAYQELAWVLREHRIYWYRDPLNYQVPYEALGAFIEICMQQPEGVVLPDIPAECIGNIECDDKGKPVFSMDTRPA